MASPSLVGLQRQPMPPAERVAMVLAVHFAQAALQTVLDTALQFDGQPLPTDRPGWYGVSATIRAADRRAAKALRDMAGSLGWRLDINVQPELSPRWPAMVPPR